MNSSGFQDGNGNGNLGGNKFSRATSLPKIILTGTVELFYLQWTIVAFFLLTIGLIGAFLLTVGKCVQ